MDMNVLNNAQKEAVLYNSGPTLVIAGAGSGKTRVLTYKIAHLIENGVNPSNILAITFTNKAASEMKHRIVSMIGISAYSATIATFHSFGARILRNDIDVIGYDKNFSILDSNDQIIVVKQIMRDLNLDTKLFSPRQIVNKISSLKSKLVSYAEYKESVDSEYEKLVCSIYEKYDKKLSDNNCVDFDDLLILPLRVFKESKEVLEKYRKYYQYMLVDEYQDTNQLQYQLIKLLSNENVFVVGDGDQSIYSWRGANVENILNFERDFKNAKVILLEENFRSTKTIIAAANDVIANNKFRKPKHLFTNNEDGELITYYKSSDELEEVSKVVDEIIRLKKSGVKLQEIAILYRTNAQSRVFEERLLKENITYSIIGSYYFYARKEIKDILAYLRLLVNPNDDISLERIINEPKRGMGSATIENLRNLASQNNLSMYEAIEHNYFTTGVNNKLSEFKNLIRTLIEYSKVHSIHKTISFILEETNYLKMLSDKSIESSLKIEYLDEFLSVAQSFEETHEEVTVEQFLQEISLVADMNQYNEVEEKLTLMTLHSAKGLEYEYVFLVGMDEELFPHKNSMDDLAQLEEERRLCYVGITRAKKRLYLSSSSTRLFLGQRNVYRPSRFVKEINSKLFEDKNYETMVTQKVKMSTKQLVDYQINQKVYHHMYGEGIIVNIEDTIIVVAFSHPHETKRLSRSFNSLEIKE